MVAVFSSSASIRDVSAAFSCGLRSNAVIYMQSLEPEVRTAINSIYDELVGNGTDRPAPDGPRTSSGSSRSESGNPVVAVAQVSSDRAPGATVERAETPEVKPVLGVVLEFATKMRQSRGREVLLND